MEVKINSKNVRAAGDRIIITKQQEEILTMKDLENLKTGFLREQNQIIQQMKNLKQRYESLTVQTDEISDMIAQLSEVGEGLPEIPEE